MHPWDLAAWAPDEFIAHLRGLGLDACNLALHYHATRLLLPANRRFTVYEDSRGGAHYTPDAARWNRSRLRPRPTAHASETGPFLRACADSGFPVNAWTVLCHNDWLGAEAPDCSVENARGDRYPYALCPANPDVAEYCATLCADLAGLPAVASLDLEAASFMGYDHGSTHERSGVPLSEALRWLLSVCFCRHCMDGYGSSGPALRNQVSTAIREFLAQPSATAAVAEWIGADAAEELLCARRRRVVELLRRIRESAPDAVLNLRFSPDPWFCGGKAALEWSDFAGLVDAATLTFFGSPPEAMQRTLLAAPRPAPTPLTVGFIFCHPDTTSELELRSRYDVAAASGAEQINFYALGLARGEDLERLRGILRPHSGNSAGR
jgi:hypothetical protein